VASTTVQATASAARGKLNLRVGELVEVRSEEESLAALDVSGELDSLPFMPETLQHWGKRFTVYTVAHKLCDTMTRTGMRRMRDAVHLTGVRCDGQAHGGCQTGCLIYWNWRNRVSAAAEPLVSIGLPVRNGERYHREAVRSVLDQDHRRLELVISDNAF
jgi:hypothetical protein